jgi:S-adenosylmethionine synthetase
LLKLEIVERKGLGHPDTICDEIAERLSLALSRLYLSEYGEILHHNVDKALLADAFNVLSADQDSESG